MKNRAAPTATYPPLPERFLFGVATADHQTEAYDPLHEDIFDVWEREVGLTRRGQATDFWNRYPEDIELARGLGCTAFRLSISWARVEPEPGVWNDEAFTHYRQVIEAVRAAGMAPVVTLHHFTWPVHVQERGGMLDERFPEWLRAYAGECARRFGASVGFWITMNEPTLLPFGFVKFWWERHYRMPPGMGEATTDEQVDAVARLIRILFLAHTAARSAIKAVHPDAMVSTNPFVFGLPKGLQDWLDYRLTHVRREALLKRHGRRTANRPPTPTGGADVTFSMLTCTRERSREVLFSAPYFETPLVVLTRADAGEPTPGPDWTGEVVVVAGSASERRLPEAFPKARPRPVATAAAARAVDRNTVFLGDEAVLGPLAEASGGALRRAPVRLPAQEYAAAVALGDTDLLDAVDTAVCAFMETGAWARSFARHFPGRPVPDPPRGHRRVSLCSASPAPRQASAEATALRTIRRRGRLVVSVRGDAPGFAGRNPETGELDGLEIDLARAVAQQILGDERAVEFRVVGLGERLASVRSPWSQWLEPIHKMYSLSSALFNTHWWHLGMAGRLPEFLCPPECVGQQDFVGFDYYWGVDSLRPAELLRLIDATEQRYDHAPVSPGGLYATLKRLTALFPGQKLLIIENGCVEAAGGFTRAEYLRDHVRQVQRASQEGLPLIGYICWSITSNREWGLPFEKNTDFGIHYIDLDHDPELRRVPTPAAEALREIIAKRGA
jgi:beta-glucosidase/6-phospho-beta-glucosidase/beta-galactosidase/ABC-type amino acid transport substrate-binding protein